MESGVTEDGHAFTIGDVVYDSNANRIEIKTHDDVYVYNTRSFKLRINALRHRLQMHCETRLTWRRIVQEKRHIMSKAQDEYTQANFQLRKADETVRKTYEEIDQEEIAVHPIVTSQPLEQRQ